MPSTISAAFGHLLSRIAPLNSELDARLRHRTTIAQGLRLAYPELNRVVVFGSHARGTAIRNFSDVDYLAVLPQRDVRWGSERVRSTTILNNCREALQSRFPLTDIEVRSPAVIIHFEDGEGSVDVVPGIWLGTVAAQDGYPKFGIPNTNGWWLETSPQRHQSYLLNRAYGRLPRLIQLFKAWKYSRETPIPFLTIHVELVLASGDHCNRPGLTYPQLFTYALGHLTLRNGADLPDPIGVGEPIPLAVTSRQQTTTLAALDYAYEHARAALAAEQAGRNEEAFRQWRLIFKDFFPAFG